MNTGVNKTAGRALYLAAWVTLLTAHSAAAADSAPVPIKVVVVAMYEIGNVTGDTPGEFQFWVEREPLTTALPFPLGNYPLHTNGAGLLAVCTDGGATNSTASIMALGLDPRFDLSKAYWLIAGIAGGDPEDVSLGTAVWAHDVVDGDLLYEIDAREIPADWPYGFVPLGADAPNEPADGWTVDTIHYRLNRGLVNWAYELTKNAPVEDSPALAEFRAAYVGYPNALRPPFVATGDTLGSSTYWHGRLMNRWANDWVKLHAGDDASFATTNMEDNGTLTALHRLARVGRVDAQRVLVLRTVSNFTMPPDGKTAAWSNSAPYPGNGLPALEAAYRIGHRVVHELLGNWSQFESSPPGSAAQDAVAQ